MKTNEATREPWHVLLLERFKNLSRQYQIADLEKRMLKENQEDKNEELSCPSPNALLRCEQRNTDAAA
ncbi:hypothetical protein [Vibrio parahaemolyticus]|uniref:hypothetical protein n=1 Tax=Vibrio parahaemolyticus TaxID=670 RepID=UPI0015DDBE6C|nr:hypothetical protein [Vibrio parahaemolyticus]